MAKHEVAISVQGVSKRFLLPHERKQSVKSIFTSMFKKQDRSIEVQRALNDVSFEVKKGEFFGVVGRNGSGKSTLLKILAGIYQPTEGTVEKKGKLVPFIELGVGFNPELTGRENVYLNGAMLGFSDKEVDAMYDNIVEFAELERFMDQKLKNYSSGMQVRLAFSMATRAQADILLVDEVLAVGDADFQRKCYKYFKSLKKQGKTVVFVSHDMNAVREFCDAAVLIEQSQIIKAGNVDEVTSAYSKLFMEGGDAKDDSTSRINRKRWGNTELQFDAIKVSPAKITQDAGTIELRCAFTAKIDNPNVVVGFALKNAAGTIMCGTNSKLLHQKTPVKKGRSYEAVWQLPNILNDGDYSLNVAIIDGDDESIQYDWWEDAKTFTVYRKQHTSYVVEPPIALHVEES